MTGPSDNPLPLLAARDPASHKGDFGRALLIGGSRGMAGAIALSGMACLRSGAGLVTIATPSSVADVVAGYHPSYMTIPLPDDANGILSTLAEQSLADRWDAVTCVALGPGLGNHRSIQRLVARWYRSVKAPMVIDADALNALSERPSRLRGAGGPRVLTPHPGEFRRLVGDTDLERAAIQLARDNRVVVVLKGHPSVITDGDRTVHNTTGNPGMATGGSGDVLTGMITALICQGLTPFEAAQMGAHLHGVAGDLAAETLGQISMTSFDLIDYLPAAFRTVHKN